MLNKLEEEDVVLVEAFYPTISPKNSSALPKWAASDEHAGRFRATVCRGPDNLPHMTKVS